MLRPGTRLCVLAAGVGLLGVTLAAVQVPAAPPAVARVDFNQDIRPLLSDRCFRCHGPDASKRKAKLRLDTREGVLKSLEDGWAIVKPGDPERSELVQRIYAGNDDDVMPPPESHLTLSDGERSLLKRWIAEGAEYAPHWSLVPVGHVPVPAAAGGAAVHPIDAFIEARMAREGLTPAAPATPEARVRRLAFNLTGLPPGVADLDAFAANPSAEAYRQLADRYLASPAYGERMAMDWLDLARYADTYGYQADVERDMSPWRDWVIRAFNENLSYRDFLIWQLAGDLLPDATPDQRLATAFNRLHRQTNEGGSVEEEFRTEYVADRVNTFGTAMLGLTLECARCHDHKFDAITQRDYFSLFAYFNSIDEAGLYSHFTNATPSPAMLLWPPTAAERQASLRARIAAAEARLEALAQDARTAFRHWARPARIQPPLPLAHLPFDAIEKDTTADAMLTRPARLQDGPVIVREGETAAMRFSGDNAVLHPAVRRFTRSDAFSVRLRLAPGERQDRAVLVHQSRAWWDAGSRGFELVLQDGKPFFALIHFWPGNAVAVRAREELPVRAWSVLTVTYDGSSRAAGIRLYLDGRALETDVVRDHLYKDISYRKEAGDSGEGTLTIGGRFRDSGFKGGLVDDLQVFDTALTAAEVAALQGGDTSDRAAAEHFLTREYAPYVATLRELQRLRALENALITPVPEIMVMQELPAPRPTFLLRRGAYDSPGEPVSRETPASLPPFPRDQPRNRLGLARWLTERGHPLTARVVVNRIWRLHFGRGLVATPEDFGSQGKLPTHPQLLDWLAGHFMESGWDVKALHRLIVTSDAFQRSSQGTSDAVARDPENLWVARGPKVRLQAEQIRDGALAASGLLVRTVGGPSVKPYQPAGLWEQSGTGKTYRQDSGSKLYRRSLYTFWRRTSPPPSLLTFDAMSREVCTARRDSTATPLQSLVLLNDPQFVEAARALAQRVLRAAPRSPDRRHRLMFRRLTGRQPDAVELGILSRLYREQRRVFAGDVKAAARFVATGESAVDRSLPPVDLAATASVASAIMAFDEFIVVR